MSVTTGPELRTTTLATSDGDGIVPPGGTLRYSATVSNTGDRDAAGVIIALPLPENTEYAADSGIAVIRSAFRTIGRASSPAYNSELSQIEWVGDIGAGENADISFDLRVKSGVAAGETIPLTGTVSYDTDGDGVNDITRTNDEPRDSSTESVAGLGWSLL